MMSQHLTLSLFVLFSLSSSSSGAAICDESKCRTIDPNDAPGYWWMPTPPDDFEGGYTCWAPISSSISTTTESEEFLPNFACAEGYTGKPVANVTQQDENDNIIAQWYTCCTDDSTTTTSTKKEDLGDQEGANTVDAIAADAETSPAATNGTVALKADYAQEQTCSDAYCDPITTPNCWAAPHGLAPRRCVDNENEGKHRFRFPRNTGATVEVDNGAQQYTFHQFLCCKEPPLNPEEEAEIESNIIGFNPELDRDGDWVPDGCSLDACTSLNGAKGGPGDCWADGVTEPFTCDTKDPNNPFVYPTRNGFDDRFIFNFHYLCCDSPNYFDDGQKGDDLHIALAIQSAISCMTTIVCFIFSAGILTNVKARSQPWNIYLVMLSIPDTIYNAFRFVYGVAVITRKSSIFIETTWFIDWFYAVANLLLNAIVVYEVHKFLRAFKGMQRIPPPSQKDVLVQSFFCYFLAFGCGVWMYFLHTMGNTITGSHPEFLKAHKLSVYCMVIPPIFVVIAICIDVWYRQLLPTSDNRTRTLALYFLRVIFVFLVTWLPYLLLISFGLRNSRLLTYIGMCISSVQGTLSVIVALSKDDVYWAAKSFVMGNCNAEPPRVEGKGRSNTRRGSVRVSGLVTSGVSGCSEVMRRYSADLDIQPFQSNELDATLPGHHQDTSSSGDHSSEINEGSGHIETKMNHANTTSVEDPENSASEIDHESPGDLKNDRCSKRGRGSSSAPFDGSYRVDMSGAVQQVYSSDESSDGDDGIVDEEARSQ